MMVIRARSSLVLVLAWLTLSTTLTFGLEMKRVLVSGGNKGIGKAICQRLLQEHESVHVLLGSRDATRGQQAIQDIVQALGPSCANRLEMIVMDTASDESVQQAAAQIASSGTPLYGIINNAGIMRGALSDVVNVNYWGPKRVIDALRPQLQTPGGRIVNIASASGPFFLQELRDATLYKKLAEPWTTNFAELDEIAATTAQHREAKSDPYGFSKALVNAYTLLLARNEPDLVVNSVTPGWIKTDMTAGQGATNPPSKGAIPPVWCLMDPSLEKVTTGRYYGSDCVRSPLHVYRGPGDAPYEGPDGLEIQKKSTLTDSK